MSDDARAIVASEYGLSPEAARFLQGETLEELEASAVALAQLIGKSPSVQEPAAPAGDAISAALASKAERQAELRALFTGRTPQPRDEQGRFASTGFDGGARKPVPPPRDPEREHGELIAQMAAISQTFNRHS